MNPFEILKLVTTHPEHLATVTKIIQILHDDPTFVDDIVKLLQAVKR